MFYLIAGIAVGIGLPMQTSINNRLRGKITDPFRTAAISFSVSLIFLAILLLLTGQGLQIPFRELAREPFWIWLGGVLGVTFLTGNMLLLPLIGAVQTAAIPVLGQLFMGLLIDHFGWFHTDVRAVTLPRIIGVILTFCGMLIVTLSRNRTNRPARNDSLPLTGGRSRNDSPSKTTHRKAASARPGQFRYALLRVISVLLGMLSASQAAINGRVGKITGSSLKASLISFIGGTAAMLLLCLIRRIAGRTLRPRRESGPWWMWIGGLIGALYVFVSAVLAQKVGTGLAVTITLTGSIAGGILIDQFGLFGTRKSPVTPVRLAGLACMLAGAALVRLV